MKSTGFYFVGLVGYLGGNDVNEDESVGVVCIMLLLRALFGWPESP